MNSLTLVTTFQSVYFIEKNKHETLWLLFLNLKYFYKV